jgi:hypothetical protein
MPNLVSRDCDFSNLAANQDLKPQKSGKLFSN